MTDFYQDTNIDALRSIQFSLGSNPLGLGFDSASYPRVDKWHLDFNTATTFGQDMANAYMSAVPIPAAAWLFFGALGLVGFVGYRAEL